jgi:hypothetical protein
LPLITEVDHERHEVRTIGVGPVTYADLETHISQERRECGTSYPELVDMTGAGIQFDSVETRKIVEMLRELSRQEPIGRTAVIVSSDSALGIAQMMAARLEDICEVKAFLSEEEARNWLHPPQPGP